MKKIKETYALLFLYVISCSLAITQKSVRLCVDSHHKLLVMENVKKMLRLVKDSVRKWKDRGTNDLKISLYGELMLKNSLIMKNGFSPPQLVFGKKSKLN